MCATCPFRDEGWKELRPLLEKRVLSEGSPICHSTGRALTKCQGKAQVCRGAQNLQLALFAAMGFIEAPTDEAWAKKAKEMKL